MPFVPALREGDAVPSVTLRDQRGRAIAFPPPGETTIVSFIYTRCKDASMCPLVAAKFARIQRSLGTASIRLVTVTLDPAYDSPRVLARYGEAYAADPAVWSLATGETAVIDELAARFGITVERKTPGVVAHDEAAFVIDARGRVATLVAGATWAPEDVLASARATAGADASPLRRVSLWLGTSASALCGGAAGGPTVGAALALMAGLTAVFGLTARRAFTRSPKPAVTSRR